MRSRPVVAVAILALVPSLALPSARKAEKDVRAADLEMARACAERNLTAFLAWIDGQSIFLSPAGPAKGAVEISDAWSGYFEEGGPALDWATDEAYASSREDLGVTIGSFTYTPPEGEPIQGRYLTVWRRAAKGGSFRVAYDATLKQAVADGAVREVVAEEESGDLRVVYGTYLDTTIADGFGRGRFVTVTLPEGNVVEAAIQEAKPTLAKARALLAEGKAAEALEMLAEITAVRPGLAEAWRVVASVHQVAERWDEAIAAGTKAAELGDPPAMYNLACALARTGKGEETLSWLERAARTGAFDITPAFFDPDLAAFHDDARLRALLPASAAMPEPFDGEVRVIHQWRGEHEGDAFGWIARSLGDVDGDGVSDFVTSAPDFGADAGRVYVYSGGSGKKLWQHDGRKNEGLGTGLACAGDVDGDGRGDVIAGAPGAGRAYVYDGRRGKLLLTLRGGGPDEKFGRSVAGAGDVNGDGRDDVIVGAPGVGAGYAALFSGKTGKSLGTIEGAREGDRFGSTVGGGRSADRTLILVGAPDAGERKRGSLTVYGDAQGTVLFTVDGDADARELGGMFCSLVGDVNGDGAADVYVSDWQHAAKGPMTGKIYVVSGKDGARLLEVAGEAAGDGFGIGPADAGDVDGDGRADLVVGAWQEHRSAPAGGRVYLVSGASGAFLWSAGTHVSGETFGFDATGMGDVDGDGRIDLLVTSGWSPIAGPRSGRVFLLAGPALAGAP